jgi:hypothetical protein
MKSGVVRVLKTAVGGVCNWVGIRLAVSAHPSVTLAGHCSRASNYRAELLESDRGEPSAIDIEEKLWIGTLATANDSNKH